MMFLLLRSSIPFAAAALLGQCRCEGGDDLGAAVAEKWPAFFLSFFLSFAAC